MTNLIKILLFLPLGAFGQNDILPKTHTVIDSTYDKVVFIDSDSVVKQRTAKIIYKKIESDDSSFPQLSKPRYEVISVWVDNKKVDPKSIIR